MESITVSETTSSDRSSNAIYHRRHVRVSCIGCGASGLLFAYKIQRSFDDFTLTILEKDKGITGTWFENEYPGQDSPKTWSDVFTNDAQLCVRLGCPDLHLHYSRFRMTLAIASLDGSDVV